MECDETVTERGAGGDGVAWGEGGRGQSAEMERK